MTSLKPPSPLNGDNGDESGLSALLKLAPYAGTLVTVATDPVGWAKGNLKIWVQELVAEWFVGGLIDAAQYGLGWILVAFGHVESIVLDAAGPLAAPYRIMSDASDAAVSGVYDAVRGVATSAGLAGPIATTFTVVVLMSILIAVAVALLSVVPGSDAIGSAKGVFVRE